MMKMLPVTNAAKESLYATWKGIWHRCNNPTSASFPHYGGRGIKMDPRWACFYCFKEDIGHRPSLGHSVDRMDVDGDYTKNNCRWATKREQANNRRPTQSSRSYAICGNCKSGVTVRVALPQVFICGDCGHTTHHAELVCLDAKVKQGLAQERKDRTKEVADLAMRYAI